MTQSKPIWAPDLTSDFKPSDSAPAMQETHVWSLGQEDSLKEMPTHSSILA